MTSETAREQFRQYCEGQIEPGSDEERIAWKAWQAALSIQPQPTREALEGALSELNAIAMERDNYEYGLPLYHDESLERMVDVLRRLAAPPAKPQPCKETYGAFYCTLPKGHQCIHRAIDGDGTICAQWPVAAPPAKPQEGKMSLLTECDRCKKTGKDAVANRTLPDGWVYYEAGTLAADPVHLCPQCEDALNSFMNPEGQ